MRKTVGVICYDYDDFNKYIDIYLLNVDILSRSKTTRKTNEILYVAIRNKLGFTGITYNYYIITDDAYKNENILDIIMELQTGSYHGYK